MDWIEANLIEIIPKLNSNVNYYRISYSPILV